MEEVEVETDEKNIFGKNKTETVKKWTGNIILSEEDFLKMNKAIKNSRITEKYLDNILNTDIYKENRELKKELEAQNSKNDDIISDYNKLARNYNSLLNENDLLKDRISDLKTEISLIYKSTRDFLKDRTGDLKAFKTIFKELIDDVVEKTRKSDLQSNFKKEYDLENKKSRTLEMSR